MRCSEAVALPIIALVTGLVLAFALINNLLNSKTIRERRHHHGNNRNKRRGVGTRQRKNSSRDKPSENRHFPQQQDHSSSYYYFRFSGVRQFLSAVKQFISYPMSTISFFSPWHEQECSAHHHHRSWQCTRSSIVQTPSSQNSTMENYYHDAIVVGLDCEMVGGGRGGWKSLLARCSVVTLDRVPQSNDIFTPCNEQIPPIKVISTNIETQPQAMGQQQAKNLNRLDENLIVLYDKYVVPKGKITDYRTEWSGITKDTYSQSQQSPIPIVSFNQCQNEITQLFSSIHGRRVVVVGHALENDFEALEIDVRSIHFCCIITCIIVWHNVTEVARITCKNYIMRSILHHFCATRRFSDPT